ncbi:MAG: ABC transporter substrate-binding protein, partial [Pseudomonas alloputida]
MGRLGNWPLWHQLLRARPCVAKGLAIWLTCALGMASSTSALALDLTDHEQAGKRLYREGVSSSDAQLQARVGASDITVPASVLP